MTMIFMFPGQGSQVVGMGKDLFDLYPDQVAQADKVLGYSLRELCLTDPNNKLNDTEFTQPALFAVNALTYLHKVQTSGVKPDFVIGHSLGEYDALYAAGAYDLATGLKLVQKRGQIMAKATGGGMAAIIGLSPTQVRDVLQNSGLSAIDVANYNSPKQTVISGLQADVARAKDPFTSAGAKLFVPLKVSGAFHSRYMRPAQEEFAAFLEQFTFAPLQLKVVANYTAKPYTDSALKDTLVQQISNSVRWVETIEYLKQQPDPQFTEVGPGKVLTKLVAQFA
jgi:malonyl CoA-acyl carrier protein transacylase